VRGACWPWNCFLTDGASSRRAAEPEQFDFVVIGSGPAGEKAAAHAAYFGKSVAVVERSEHVGGVPVSSAGIPTKTLREAALYVTGFRRREIYGVRAELESAAAIKVLRQRTEDVTRLAEQQVRTNLERHHIEVLHGSAALAGSGLVRVALNSGGERTLRGHAILLATGSRPLHPPGIPFDDPDVHDSNTVFKLDRTVSSIAIIGAGAVGCEYASIFTALDAKVWLVDGAARPLRFMDEEISRLFAESLTRMGATLMLAERVDAVERGADGLQVRLASGATLMPDTVLFAAGRLGNTENLGMEEAGVKLDGRGRVIVNERFETSAPGIFAAGDVIGPPALASVSMEQGRLAAAHAFQTGQTDTGDFLPTFGVYSVPEVAMVGMTEADAARAGIDYEVGRAAFSGNTRATIAGATEGMVKLVFRRDDRRLLGVHVIGEIASEVVHLGQAVIHHGGRIDYFIHATFNVPTWTDAYKYAAFDGLGRLATVPTMG
jgi:NAD(P) transhydrogenase